MKHLEGVLFLCYFINLSVKLPKLEFARTSLDGINTYFHSFFVCFCPVTCNFTELCLKPFFISPLITKISIVHFHQTENLNPMQLPNNIHLNLKNRHDIHPKRCLVVLLQFFNRHFVLILLHYKNLLCDQHCKLM